VRRVPEPTFDPQQRRVLGVLVLAQVLSGAGLAAGITVGALLAQEMLGSTGWAGVPAALFTIGSAVAALVVGRISQRGGRRPGLALGYAVGAVGSAGVVVAAVLDSVPLLFATLLVYGAGSATNLQARYAGADLAAPERRGRAVSTVLVATTLGAVVGPNLVAPMGDVARAFGVPALAGPFILAGLAYAAAATVLWVLLRPDPLLLARARAVLAAGVDTHTGSVAGTSGAVVATAAIVMVVAQFVMIAIMTMTPVHMIGHGHGVGSAGLVIGVHVAAMFLPSPVSGWLVDRFGPAPVAAASGVVLLCAGALAASVSVDSIAGLSLALALLGLGWSFGIVSGTAMLSGAVPLERRASTQGAVDVAIAVAGAGGGLGSGLVVEAAGYAGLTLLGGTSAMLIVVALAMTASRRRGAVATGA
jgi:MFS family permease